MNAAWENLLGATLALTTSDPIKQRLIRTFSEHLKQIDPADLPREIRVAFREITQRLSSARPMRGETAVAATVRKMSNQEVEACAQSIVHLFAQCRRGQNAPVELATTVVPLYAALADNVPPLLAVNQA